MKINDILYNGLVEGNKELEIDLLAYYPIGKIDSDNEIELHYLLHDRWEKTSNPKNLNNQTARFIRILARQDTLVKIRLGMGYIAYEEKAYTDAFKNKSGWTGGDGIFSFNIKNGNDSFNQEDSKTVFVFGDTFVGEISNEDDRRVPPILMPNNTLAYIDGFDTKNVSFDINTDNENQVCAFFNPDNSSLYEGYTALNLVDYSLDNINPYLSGYNPHKLELEFKFPTEFFIDYIDIYNYFDKDHIEYNPQRRGFKDISILLNVDNKYIMFKEISLGKSNSLSDYQEIIIGKKIKGFKIVVDISNHSGNYQDQTEDLTLYGLNKVKVYSNKQLLKDIEVNTNNVLNKTKKHAWFWLQDGVVINEDLYFLPLLVEPDLTQKEGMQFKISGVSLIKVPIINEVLDTSKQTQKRTPLFYQSESGYQIIYGNAIMPLTKQSGNMFADGYIYIYGYITENYIRKLVVSRVLEKDFENIDLWEYFDGVGYSKNMFDSAPILEHISCEMSVSPITKGINKGKFVAIYQYDVNSSKIAYSIGDTPVGPFSEPTIFYSTENIISKYGNTTYTYNAKAHPHLSLENELLVSYNVNTYQMEHHEKDGDVYRPRFIKLVEIENE